ncbi:hypothetical protein HPC49_07815 [Pyxidicoccus fallax]|uniref:Zinc-finger domain-containing protein n=1 Tax=Pyxidicoccus fallax TaxID=394095 RepID=A0A848LGF6_9BACT|nr:hypothetical protein [Pyxidicoccus fallax]NMO16355.1 hypothetical protein [Pyxidicoccus fallax]NPC78159.1 hypothetical protein [Pyxidicoccus fallax]
MNPACAVHPLVDRHFSGRIHPRDEQRLRAHLPDCPTCRERYERHLLLARLDPRALDARTRLARGLGLDARAPTPPWRLALVPVAVACLALLVVRIPWNGTSIPDDGFTPRGAGNTVAEARLLAYAVEPGGRTTLLGPTLRPDQELAFAFRNPDAHRFLMVFARDAAGQVYWYHPSWTDPASNPSAIAIPPGDALRELPEAISHSLPPGPLALHAVFLDAPLTVRQMEALLTRTGSLDSVLPSGADSTSLQLQVVP